MTFLIINNMETIGIFAGRLFAILLFGRILFYFAGIHVQQTTGFLPLVLLAALIAYYGVPGKKWNGDGNERESDAVF